MKRIIPIISYFTIIASITFSCAPTRSAAYLSQKSKGEFSNAPDYIYTIENVAEDTIHVNDELFISVTTSSDEPNSFAQPLSGVGGNVDLISYIVDSQGYIKLPYLQRFKMEGMTINEATDTIESVLSQYLYIPTVSIRIINHRFSVLGEVNSPGMYTFSQKSINIYQAIAQANDITVFGNRKNVLIVRQDGTRITRKYINLLDEDIITSEWYIINPDDIIFVEPLGRKALGMETIPYDLIFSVFSSTLLTMTFLISIFNN